MEYINLGLPSKTLWADYNEKSCYTFDEAAKKFGDNLPSNEMWRELIDNCKWEWNSKKKGFDVIGPNDNSIFLPANNCKGDTDRGLLDAGYGCYWSSSLDREFPNLVWSVYSRSNYIGESLIHRSYKQSIRLIKTN